MDGAVPERPREGIVDEAMLVDEREIAEALAYDGGVEVVAAARAVDDGDLGRLREGSPEQRLKALGHERDRSSERFRRDI